MTAPFSHPEPHPGGAVRTDMWVVVAEFTGAGTPNPFVVADLETLIAELAFWRPSGLWSDDRYAVQLQIAAPSHYQALQAALACHRQALRVVGFAPSILHRVEVFKAEELERDWAVVEQPENDVGSGVHCPPVYLATRALLAAVTSADVARAVDDFVVAIGARVELGPSRHLDGTTDVDLVGDGGALRHASAEAFSVSGLLLEQALPNLVVDARRALSRVRIKQSPATPDGSPVGDRR